MKERTRLLTALTFFVFLLLAQFAHLVTSEGDAAESLDEYLSNWTPNNVQQLSGGQPPSHFSHLTEPNDPFYPLQWGLNNEGINIFADYGVKGVIDADIDAPQAWEHLTESDKLIAVLDTGVDLDHPDLKGNIWQNPSEKLGDANGDGFPGVKGVDDDGDGLIDEDSNGNVPGTIEIPGNDETPCWSPDGSQIAFSSDRNGPRNIYICSGTGHMIAEISRITYASATDTDPSWSPDGTKIAFSSDRDGDFEIYIMNADGSDITQVTSNTAQDSHPTWNDEGDQIAFTSDRDGDFEIYKMNADGTDVIQLTNNSWTDKTPTWSPDGTKITFVSNGDGNLEIYTMNPDGTGIGRLTINAASDDNPSWGLTGEQIFFDSDRTGDQEIWVVNATSGDLNQVNTNPAADTHPTVIGSLASFPEEDSGSTLAKVAFSSDRTGNLNIWTIVFPEGEPASRLTFTGFGSAYTNDLRDDDDENGYVDDFNGWNFVDNNNDVTDDNGHGTHVSGIIAAVGNNGIGIAGVCWKAKLMILKILDEDGFLTSHADAAKAIKYAAKNGAKIINNSWGGRNFSKEVKKAIEFSNSEGAIFVAAAGNWKRRDTDLDNDERPFYPASYGTVPSNIPNVIAVAATDNRDNLTWFSHYGQNSVHLAAPGERIYSTVPPFLSVTGYMYMNGTSMAAPHVSGAIAHFWTLFPALTHLEVKDWILDVDRVDSRPGIAGRVNSGMHNDGRLRMICGDDFGDAPDPFTGQYCYPTKTRRIGASHEDIGEEWLGFYGDVSPEFDAHVKHPWDADPDGLPNILPDLVPPTPEPPYIPGAIPDLEAYDDGISFRTPFVPCHNATIAYSICTENEDKKDLEGGRYRPGNSTILAPDKRLYINIWIDWNRNGIWEEGVEHVWTHAHDPTLDWNGTHCSKWLYATFHVPSYASLGVTWLRARLDYGENVGKIRKYDSHGSLVNPYGLAQFGEVEDYPLKITPPMIIEYPVLMDLEDPLFTTLDELYPEFGKNYQVVGWSDTNGNCLLDPGDFVGLYNPDLCPAQMAIWPYWWYIEDITVTLNVSKKPDLNTIMYIEYADGWSGYYSVVERPENTQWRELYSGDIYDLPQGGWKDNCDSRLSPCDSIVLTYRPTGEQAEYKVRQVKTNIYVSPRPTCASVGKIKNSTAEGYPLAMPIFIDNYYPNLTSFTVAVYYDGFQPIGNQTIHLQPLEAGDSRIYWTEMSTWPKGTYNPTITINVQANNTIIYSEIIPLTFKITILGDVNGDGRVDLKDVYTAGLAYGSHLRHPRWNPNVDVNNDFKIDLKDYYVVCKNFGNTYP